MAYLHTSRHKATISLNWSCVSDQLMNFNWFSSTSETTFLRGLDPLRSTEDAISTALHSPQTPVSQQNKNNDTQIPFANFSLAYNFNSQATKELHCEACGQQHHHGLHYKQQLEAIYRTKSQSREAIYCSTSANQGADC